MMHLVQSWKASGMEGICDNHLRRRIAGRVFVLAPTSKITSLGSLSAISAVRQHGCSGGKRPIGHLLWMYNERFCLTHYRAFRHEGVITDGSMCYEQCQQVRRFDNKPAAGFCSLSLMNRFVYRALIRTVTICILCFRSLFYFNDWCHVKQ